MSENVEPIVYEILKRIQADLTDLKKDTADFRRETAARFDSVETRLDRLENLGRRHTRDIAGLLFLGKAMAGQWAEEIAAIDKRLTTLEARG